MIRLMVKDLVLSIGLDSYEIVGFRPFGEEIKELIIEKFEIIHKNEFIILDFDGVKSSDLSFIDEVVLEVNQYLRNCDKDMLLVCANISEYVMQSLKGAQLLKEEGESNNKERKVNFPVLVFSNREITVIGNIEKNLIETFSVIKDNGITTARVIGDRFNIAINSASNRLKKLYDYRLVLRKECNDDTGKYYEYFVPKISD